ncbi:gamma-glutamyltransferase [Sphingomonas sp. ASY06-1R]|uniref:gamma-glutamyltransferase n=1 Tax=Sphingomonas sp. ASY06-1R TaxID=3445771 RepID=UPI003FA2F6AC
MRRFTAASIALLVVATSPARAASPMPVAAEHGMIVSAHHLATDAGLDILKQGGNAIDAAVAVGYALAVTFPEAGNIGGGGFMTIRFHDGRTTFIDFRETAPMAATARLYQDVRGNVIPGLSTRGYKAVAIPGTVAGLELARAAYGTRARATLMAPAIRLAREGFPLDQADADFLAEGIDDFRKDAPTAAIFTHAGKPWKPGERLVQADLARSLQQIAQNGPRAFYQGPIAAAIVAASRAQGGIVTVADFAAYTARERKPLECDYRGWHMISAPPPSSGGVVLCETLNIVEGYPIGQLGFHSAQGTHYLIEAFRRAYHDRNLNLGDPAFVKADIGRLADKAYAASLRAGIDPDRATPSASLTGPGGAHEGQSTTHYSIVDVQGNAVSVTYTLNDWFGARLTAPGTGILLNDEMDDFSAKPGVPNMFGLVEGANNAIAPGKRPLSSMTPTIVTRDGKLAMVVGTPGGSRIPSATLQVIMNVIDFGMTLQEAVDAPRIHEQWLPDQVGYERFAFSADTKAALEAKGHKLEEMPYGNQIAAILVGAPSADGTPIGNNRLYGSIDPRIRTGNAKGY